MDPRTPSTIANATSSDTALPVEWRILAAEALTAASEARQFNALHGELYSDTSVLLRRMEAERKLGYAFQLLESLARKIEARP